MKARLTGLVLAISAIGLGLGLTGCREGVSSAETAPTADNPLEQAARDANLVVDPHTTLPTGLFERRHAAGRDALCLRPDDSDTYRFGIIASFGSDLICQGRGSAKQEGNELRLSFAMPERSSDNGTGCAITARYDGQSVQLPGSVPDGCAALCGPRASLSGVAVARVGWQEEDALSLRSRSSDGAEGRPLCQ